MSILDKQFIIVGGKGGVGRTSVAAALGTVTARRGRRTLLAHVRCKQRLDALLGVDEIGTDICQVEPNLWAVNMTPAAAIEEMGLLVLKFRTVYRAVFESRMVKYFLRAVPALEEYSMIGKAWYHTSEKVRGKPRFDTVIFDGPATGHLITMLRVPQVIIDTVPRGPLTADAERVHALMTDPYRTGLWLVTLAEEMPVSEALDLDKAAANTLRIARDALVVNMLYPDPLNGQPELAETLQRARAASNKRGDDVESVLRSTSTMLERHRINEVYLDKLSAELPLRQIRLPHLFGSTFERAAVDILAERIEAAVGEAAP